ncbi:MAG: helix-turn-helix domain-containing protein [Planctomycetota bacterium]
MTEAGKGEAAAGRELYTVPEAAEYLGVSVPTIFRWMRDRTLSFYKIGGATRFDQSGLNAVFEKTTGEKEARASSGRCASCGHNVLVEGRVQSTGRMYFRPAKTKFWTFLEPLIQTEAKMCPACGFLHLYADTEKLSKLKTEK